MIKSPEQQLQNPATGHEIDNSIFHPKLPTFFRTRHN
jgi:hypothetical protein